MADLISTVFSAVDSRRFSLNKTEKNKRFSTYSQICQFTIVYHIQITFSVICINLRFLSDKINTFPMYSLPTHSFYHYFFQIHLRLIAIYP